MQNFQIDKWIQMNSNVLRKETVTWRPLKVLSFIFPEVSLLELFWSPKIMRSWFISSNIAILVNKLHIVGYPFKPVDNGAFFVPISSVQQRSVQFKLLEISANSVQMYSSENAAQILTFIINFALLSLHNTGSNQLK